MRWILGMLVWLTAATSWAQVTSFSGIGTNLATTSRQWKTGKAEASSEKAAAPKAPVATEAASDEAEASEEEDSEESGSETPNYANQREWVTLRFGGGGEFLYIVDPGSEENFGRGWNATGRNLMLSVGLLTICKRHFFVSPGELDLAPFIGNLGVGLRLGGRIPLYPDWRFDVRFGAYAGGSFTFLSGDVLNVRLAPFVEFHSNQGWGSIGAGASVPITFMGHHVGAWITGDDSAYTPSPMIGGLLYFAVAFGRS